MLPLVTFFLLFAAPTASDDRFVHFLGGVPVGEIRLIRTGPSYTYLSQHFFRGGQSATKRFSPPGEDPTVWASESLLAPHPVGCWPVEDELTRQRGEVCVTQAGAITQGTLLGKPFTARYQGKALTELTVGESRFVRREGAVAYGDPFGEGLLLTGNGPALALTPAIKGARPARPKPSGENQDCLAAANGFVTEHPEYEVVLGVIDDGTRGWPHAWVIHRKTGQELDPSRPPRAGQPPRYLALPKDEAAGVYLDLLAKRRTLTRVGAP